MKSLARFLFVNSTLSWLLLLLILLAGGMSYTSMLKENNPDLAIPQALVITEWPGAAPEQVEKQLTKELEDKIRGLKGLKKYSSGSQNSFSTIAVEFEADIAIADAMARLRAKVSEAEAELPQAVKKPTIEQVSVNDEPVISYMLHGTLDPEVMADVAKSLKKQVEAVKGVKKVELSGQRKKSVHIRLMPERIKALGVSPLLVQQRLQQANRDMAWGEFEMQSQVLKLYVAGRFEDLESLKRLPIIRLQSQRLVRLEEVALVFLGLDQEKTRTDFSIAGGEFQTGISFSIKKRPGSDSLTVIADVKAFMAQLQQGDSWPYGLHASVVNDESEIINDSFANVFSNIWQAMLAVFVVLLVLLSWREATIAGLAIPVTFLTVLAILYFQGFTLNTMVIIGMVLALGLLVDVFILVMEGMHEHMFIRRQTFSQAALNTVKTYAMPAFAGQLTTILAMAPMMAIGGVDGKFIRLIPVTAVLCLIASFVIAFLLCIPLSRYLLDSQKDAGPTPMDRALNGVTGKMNAWLLRHPLRNRKLSALYTLSAFGLLILSLTAASSLPSELYPRADGRNLGITLRLSPDASLEQSQEVANKVGEYLRQQTYFSNVTRYVGAKSPYAIGSLKEQLLPQDGYNLVGFSALFVPKDDRPKLAFEYLDELRKGLDSVLQDTAGVSVIMTPDLGGSSKDDPVMIEISGADLGVLADLVKQAGLVLETVEGATDVRDNIGAWRSQLRIFPDHEALSFYGISEDSLMAQLRLATEADEIGKFKVEGVEDDFPIRLGTYWQSRPFEVGGPRDIAELSLVNVFTPQGKHVPLTSLVDYRIIAEAPVLTHTSGKRTILLQAKTQSGVTAQQVLERFLPQLEKLKRDWPSGYEYRIAGEAESSEETFGSAGKVFVLAIVMVFAVLAVLFNSFRQPVVVIMTIPLALIGTFGGFVVLGIPFSFPAMIGLISLVGIVVNNAIVMLETINQHRAKGMGLRDAAARGATDRLRPIVGTTLTTTVGLVPLALSDPMWYPLCMAIILGLLVSTLISLLVVPAMLVLLSGAEKLEQES